MSILSVLQRAYHTWIPLNVRRQLRLTRWTANRRVRAHLWNATGGRVVAGPFAGQRLHAAVPDDCEGAVLLGSFESETHEFLEREFARGWRFAVNVGSNAGFYSTGIAMRITGATVYAFELDPVWRAETRWSAEANGVTARVEALGAADVDALASLAVPVDEGALVVCDCEGYERDLLDPTRIPWLAASALCIELHDFAAPGATDTLRARFAATHDLEIVEQQPRDAAVWASRAGISVSDAALLCDETRSWGDTMNLGRWMLAAPRSRTE